MSDTNGTSATGGNITSNPTSSTVFYSPVTCPYQEKCRDNNTGLCSSCKHNKKSYYEPIPIYYPYTYYPYYPYYPYTTTVSHDSY